MVSTLKNTLAFVSKRITGLPAHAPHASWGWQLPQSSEPGGRAAREAEVLLQLSELLITAPVLDAPSRHDTRPVCEQSLDALLLHGARLQPPATLHRRVQAELPRPSLPSPTPSPATGLDS